MSTHHDTGSQYQNHYQAAELHDKAAHAHRVAAAADYGKQDRLAGHQHSSEALEHSQRAYLHTQELHKANSHEHRLAMFGHHDIAALAHELWQARGCPEGTAEQDWHTAVERLRSQ